jgi:osmotically-inducible protein OsmY
MKKFKALFVIALLLASPAIVTSMTALAQDDASPMAPDNTGANGSMQQSPTADQAGQQLSDRQIMQKIRSSVVGDKSLSMYAHNVKIISSNGKVVLKGPVRSDDEKTKIDAAATAVVGAQNVTDQMTIKAKSSAQ